MEKLMALIKKVCTKEVIFYAIFGVLTTVINIAVFYFLHYVVSFEKNLANNISIVIAVLFAYFTNRKLVFNSTAVTFKEKFKEFYKFILGRVFTMVFEMIGFYLLATIIGFQELASKIFITILVIILNFFISKFFAFKKQTN